MHRKIDDVFYCAGIKEILDGIIIGRSSDYDEISSAVGFFGIQRRFQIQFLILQIILDVIILDRRDPLIDHIDLFFYDIDRCDCIVLCQQGCDGQSDIACSGNGDLSCGMKNLVFLWFLFADIFIGETQDLLQIFQLFNGRHVAVVFQLGKDGPVDPDPISQFRLGKIHFFSFCLNGFRQFVLINPLHHFTSNVALSNNHISL